MKKLISTTICLILVTLTFGQDAKEYYLKGLAKAQAGELNEAIKFFTKTIELQPDDYYAWYNRGIVNSMQDMYEEALPDFEQTIKLAPKYKKAYLNRGITRKHLTDYEGALADYSYAIELDPDYAEAYYNRAMVYEMLGKRDSACIDFNQANELGLVEAKREVEKCKDTTVGRIKTHPILRLTKTSIDEKYGFTSEKPILVGSGPSGGPSNQRAYLELLRDKQGKPLKYRRLGSCCEYKSEHGFFGMALLDKYEISFLNEKGKESTAIVYISFYDYEEPLILLGFKTIGQK